METYGSVLKHIRFPLGNLFFFKGKITIRVMTVQTTRFYMYAFPVSSKQELIVFRTHC